MWKDKSLHAADTIVCLIVSRMSCVCVVHADKTTDTALTLRIFLPSVLRLLKQFSDILAVFSKVIRPLMRFFAVLLMMTYLFSILGMEFFATKLGSETTPHEINCTPSLLAALHNRYVAAHVGRSTADCLVMT